MMDILAGKPANPIAGECAAGAFDTRFAFGQQGA
jgi:hypothetical protein